MDDLLNEFITETTENLAAVDVELVKFEQEPQNAEILQNIFRMVHTVKGTCGFLDLPRLEAVAHAGENVLGKFRDGELAVTPVAVTLILKCIDRIRGLMSGLEETGEEPEGDDCQLIDELNTLAEGRGAAPEPAIGEAGIFEAAETLADVETVNAAGTRTASADEMLAGMAVERASKQDQAGGRHTHPQCLPRGRPCHHRDRRRRQRSRYRKDIPQNHCQRACQRSRSRDDERSADRPVYLQTRFLDGGKSSRRLRAWCRHGCGVHQHRKNRRRCRIEDDCRKGRDLHHQDPADPGHRLDVDRREFGPALRHSADQRLGAGADIVSIEKHHRDDQRITGAETARPFAAPGIVERTPQS